MSNSSQSLASKRISDSILPKPKSMADKIAESGGGICGQCWQAGKADQHKVQGDCTGEPLTISQARYEELMRLETHCGLTNTEKSQIELYKFVRDMPDDYLFYIDTVKGSATTWTGESFGTVSLGRVWTSNMGDVRQRVTVRTINGLIYAGTYFKSVGDFANVKRVYCYPEHSGHRVTKAQYHAYKTKDEALEQLQLIAWAKPLMDDELKHFARAESPNGPVMLQRRDRRIITFRGQTIEACHIISQGGWCIWINDVTHFGAYKTMRAAHLYAIGYIKRHPDKFGNVVNPSANS